MYPRYRSGFSPFGRHQPHSANGRHTTNSRYEPRSVSPNDQNNAASPAAQDEHARGGRQLTPAQPPHHLRLDIGDLLIHAHLQHERILSDWPRFRCGYSPPAMARLTRWLTAITKNSRMPAIMRLPKLPVTHDTMPLSAESGILTASTTIR